MGLSTKVILFIEYIFPQWLNPENLSDSTSMAPSLVTSVAFAPRTTPSLIKIAGVDSKSETDFYLGKRVAFITKASTEKNGSRYRVNWGRVCRSHGGNGVVRCRFNRDLPPQAIGGRV